MNAAKSSSLLKSSTTSDTRFDPFANVPLGIKLILALLLMTALSAAADIFLSNRTIRAGLSASVGEQLTAQANQVAASVTNLADREIVALQTFALNPELEERVEEINAAYDPNTDLHNEMMTMDGRWSSLDENDPLIQSRLNSNVAEELREFRTIYPDHSLLLIVDKYGALAAATDRPREFFYADKDWWKAAWNDGKGAIYIGQPIYNKSLRVFVLEIAAPLRKHENQEIVGILYTSLRLDRALKLVKNVQVSESEHAHLILPDSRLVEFETGQVVELNKDLAGQVKAASEKPIEIIYENIPRFLAVVPVRTISGESVIDKLGWSIMLYRSSEAALQPLNDTIRTTLLATLGALVLATVLGIVLTQAISRPLRGLTDAAGRIAAGDLSRRLHFKRRDEIGVLANSFDKMAESLEDRIRLEQEARTEAQLLQQAETENRQRLERAVAEFMTFTQQIAQGDLTQRLQVNYDGALGLLSQGLNGMAANLHAITSQAQETTNAIATATAQILAATTEQAASAAEQSAAITETATSVEEVKVIAQQTARQATTIAQSSQASLQVARKGAQAVNEMISGLSQIRQHVGGVSQTIQSLSSHSQTIGTIVTTLSDLADQINHLALNAAIESTRIGKEDREIAQLSQLVRDLSTRAKTSTSQVRELLIEIRNATYVASQGAEAGRQGVESGASLAGQAGEVIQHLSTEVESGAQSNVQMAAAAHQQTIGMEQIGLAMTNIQQATSQALAGTRQVEQAAQDLHALAQSLQQAIAAYRL